MIDDTINAITNEAACHICGLPYNICTFRFYPSKERRFHYLVVCGDCHNWINQCKSICGVEIDLVGSGSDVISYAPKTPLVICDKVRDQYLARKQMRRKLAKQLPNSPSSSTVSADNESQSMSKGNDMRVSSGSIPFDKEESGDVTTYTTSFEVKDGSRAVMRCVVAVIEEVGEPVKLYTNIQPLGSDLGVELRREETYVGEFARTFADAIAAARDFLGDSNGTHHGNTGRSVHIDLDI